MEAYGCVRVIKKGAVNVVLITISAKASSDPPNISIVVLRPKAALFLLMKSKSESIQTEILARRDAV